ncbi:hypothetical protein HY488_02825, partial [Candidatus Woesearchaeota archaeon]|nr:hypothetical protein [Candidatus Woesearchaeota archaeon]
MRPALSPPPANPVLQQFWEDWSKREIRKGQRFDDIFAIEGIPLWWLLYTMVQETNIPPPFRSINEFERDILSQQRRRWLPRAHFWLFRLALQIGLGINERLKRIFALAKQKQLSMTTKQGILFVDYVHRVKWDVQKNCIELYKAEIVRKKLEVDRKFVPIIVLLDRLSKNGGRLLLQFNNLIYHYLDKEVLQQGRRKAKKLSEAWRALDGKTKRQLFSIGKNKSAWPSIKEEFDLLFSRSYLSIIT